MQNNLIKIQDGTIYRILQERDSEWLVIRSVKSKSYLQQCMH